MDARLASLHHAHAAALQGFFEQSGERLLALAERCADQLQAGHKLLFCGNGGSACDAMHIVGEFVGRFVAERRGLPAIALSADSGILTAVGNDYGFDQIFARQVEALGQAGDVLMAMSTSGSSPNVLRALAVAREKGLITVLWTGEKGRSSEAADYVLAVPSTVTAHIQEAHMVALHGLAGWVEQRIFNDLLKS